MNLILKQLFATLISYGLRLDWLEGHRTEIAGMSSIFTGLVFLLEMAASGTYSEEKLGMAVAFILFGLRTIGMATKNVKLLDAINKLQPTETPPTK